MDIILKAKIVKDFGAGVVLEVELGSINPVKHDAALIEFNLLADCAVGLVEHFMDHQATDMKIIGQQTAGTLLTVPATEIRVKMEKGKRMWSVICGTWQEYGVPFYPEHMKACGINPHLIPDEGYKFKKENTRAVVQMENGKAKRVIKIVSD